MVRQYQGRHAGRFDSGAGAKTKDDDMTEDTKERRERIATAALAGLLANASTDDFTYEMIAEHTVSCADALIAELDKPTEATELDRLRARVAELEAAMPTDEERKDIDWLLVCIDGHPNAADEYERV